MIVSTAHGQNNFVRFIQIKKKQQQHIIYTYMFIGTYVRICTNNSEK